MHDTKEPKLRVCKDGIYIQGKKLSCVTGFNIKEGNQRDEKHPTDTPSRPLSVSEVTISFDVFDRDIVFGYDNEQEIKSAPPIASKDSTYTYGKRDADVSG